LLDIDSFVGSIARRLFHLNALEVGSIGEVCIGNLISFQCSIQNYIALIVIKNTDQVTAHSFDVCGDESSFWIVGFGGDIRFAMHSVLFFLMYFLR